MFSEFRELKLEELKRTRELHGHTERVMRAVENSVNAMDDPDSLRAYLTELGRRHVYRSAKPSVGNVSSQCRYHGTECRYHSYQGMLEKYRYSLLVSARSIYSV